jgi:hypothetical protein
MVAPLTGGAPCPSTTSQNCSPLGEEIRSGHWALARPAASVNAAAAATASCLALRNGSSAGLASAALVIAGRVDRPVGAASAADGRQDAVMVIATIIIKLFNRLPRLRARLQPKWKR